MDTDLRFSVLGPLRAWRGDEAVPLGPPKQRQVLALLLLAGGAIVPRQRLIDALWPEGAPLTAHKAVHGHVGRLRRVLEPGRTPRQPARL
ncbi:AfsR/SARP family transcriptional regulator, partial [Actinocorallia lasiicapitis]